MQYDAIVIGAGHAGCEAALALARMGKKTLCMAINLDAIALMACNPAIGGTSKGHLVREIDAMGGQMGIAADACFIQSRMLNTAKGPAVHSLRAQEDKNRYSEYMKSVMESQYNLDMMQAEVCEIILEKDTAHGVRTAIGTVYYANAVVVATGVYQKSRIITGEYIKESGPSGLLRSEMLSDSLKRIGISLMRFKTGTPPRIDACGVDFKVMQVQHGDNPVIPFSFSSSSDELSKIDQLPCYMTYTNAETHEVLRENIHRSPMYSGVIDGTGARYCPSIEDKIVRFADKERHQLFIEPEGRNTTELYVQGFSTSMPADVQQKALNTIEGLEHARIVRYGYAIEYDCIDAREMTHSMMNKKVKGLFFAGQICGSSGYEEAAAQGIMAGINASRYLDDAEPIVLNRSDGYIGVLIDDLVIKGTNEPYRMMTSRAEYRLMLRQDNADLRLTEYGKKAGLVNEERYDRFLKKKARIEELKDYLQGNRPSREQLEHIDDGDNRFAGKTWWELMKKGDDISARCIDALMMDEDSAVIEQIKISSKYEGYLQMQERDIKKMLDMENKKLSVEIDYMDIKALRIEAQQKLNSIKPENVGQASRISGVSPADIMVLCVWLESRGMK